MKLGCLWLVGVALLGCGSDKEEDPLSSANGFCEEWAKRSCSKAVISNCGADDEKACRQTQAEYCEDIVPSTLYSQAGAEECLEYVETAYKDGELSSDERDAVRSLAAPCDLVLSGNGQADDKCNENSDCDREGGFDCIVPPGSVYGSCQRPDKIGGGGTCDGEADVCSEGFYCAATEDDEKNCVARKNVGKACSETVPCALGLNCEATEADGATVCVARMKENEEGCEADSDCATGICQSNGTRSLCLEFIRLDPLEPICDDLR